MFKVTSPSWRILIVTLQEKVVKMFAVCVLSSPAMELVTSETILKVNISPICSPINVNIVIMCWALTKPTLDMLKDTTRPNKLKSLPQSVFYL